MSIGKMLYFLTIEQWKRINEDYVINKERTSIDWKSIVVFILFTCVLIALKYFGKYPTFQYLFGDTFQSWPYPNMYSLLYWALVRVVGYFILPASVVRWGMREPIRNYGFRIDRNPKVLLLYLAMFLVVIPLVYLVSHNPNFLHVYPFYKQTANSWTELFIWEFAYAMQFVALEFFFRGFVLFSFARYIGVYAIFLMSVPYTMIHFQKPLPETLGAVIAGVALGTLALRTRSIFGGVFIHVAVAWSMDITALWQKGLLQKLLFKTF
jgi:membrane protease YdiL (CAAX protease family)